MNYKPSHADWMAYLYNEMEGAEKEKMEQYLLSNAEARLELEQFRMLRKQMGAVQDKEVIAPPIVMHDNQNQRFIWNSPYLKLVSSIAASLLIIMLIGWLTNAQISAGNGEFKISFGKQQPVLPQQVQSTPTLTSLEVQNMIQQAVAQNNQAMQTSWSESQQKFDASIKENLALNSAKVDQLVREASTASQDQIRSFVATMQAENMASVKNYFQLTSTEQKDYIENLLVDFAKYLQQQRNDDLQLVETRLARIEQNNTVFKQETEQILSSIISTVGNTNVKEVKY